MLERFTDEQFQEIVTQLVLEASVEGRLSSDDEEKLQAVECGLALGLELGIGDALRKHVGAVANRAGAFSAGTRRAFKPIAGKLGLTQLKRDSLRTKRRAQVAGGRMAQKFKQRINSFATKKNAAMIGGGAAAGAGATALLMRRKKQDVEASLELGLNPKRTSYPFNFVTGEVGRKVVTQAPRASLKKKLKYAVKFAKRRPMKAVGNTAAVVGGAALGVSVGKRLKSRFKKKTDE